jgi:hypothetical protein
MFKNLNMSLAAKSTHWKRKGKVFFFFSKMAPSGGGGRAVIELLDQPPGSRTPADLDALEAFVQGNDFLQSKPRNVRRELLTHARAERFRPGVNIIAEGDRTDGRSKFYIVLSGSAGVFKERDVQRDAVPHVPRVRAAPANQALPALARHARQGAVALPGQSTLMVPSAQGRSVRFGGTDGAGTTRVEDFLVEKGPGASFGEIALTSKLSVKRGDK